MRFHCIENLFHKVNIDVAISLATHTHTHACTHTHTHTLHTRAHTYTTHTGAHMHTLHTQVHTCTHYTHTEVHTAQYLKSYWWKHIVYIYQQSHITVAKVVILDGIVNFTIDSNWIIPSQICDVIKLK